MVMVEIGLFLFGALIGYCFSEYFTNHFKGDL